VAAAEIDSGYIYQEEQTQDLTLDYGTQGKLPGPTEVSYTRAEYIITGYDDQVLTLDDQGNYQITGVGNTTVIGSFYDEYDNMLVEITYNITVPVDMTDVTLDQTSQTKYIYKNRESCPSYEFNLQAGSTPLPTSAEDYTLKCKSSNSSIKVVAQMWDNGRIVVIPSAAGKTTLTLTVNGKEFTATIRTVAYDMNKTSLLLVTKKTGQMKVTGLTGSTQWSSSNTKVAKVSSSGKVTALKNGNALIKAVVTTDSGKYTVGCVVSVVSQSRYKAVKTAIRIAKNGTYSQAKRMQSGYYDCSSLVWRAYKSAGVYLAGVTSGNAPVAASIGKWIDQKKKRVSGGMSDKNVQAMKLHAGDLMFEEGYNNGRYKGIYHVEMIAGYCCEGFDSNGKAILGIVWANRTEDYYAHFGQMIGRP
jgi:cell wall-associated NlpC family hydrolase